MSLFRSSRGRSDSETPSPPPEDTMKIATEGSNDVLGLMTQCPQFRILVIGRTGTGKTTICSRVFNIPYHAAVTRHGAVWEEIHFPEINDSVIFHDSGGFEAGSSDAINEVEKFIRHRRNQPRLQDQIHCIWYCISCADIRPFQPSERRFFLEFDVGNVPVVVVFTQWDKLVQQKIGETVEQYGDDDNMTTRQIRELGKARATEHYETELLQPLNNMLGHKNKVVIRRTALPPGDARDPAAFGGLDHVLEETRKILTSDGLKTLLVMAQRVDADSKLRESLALGVTVFWQVQGWAAVPIVPGLTVTAQSIAFKKVYRMIIRLWNIPTQPLGVFERRDVRHGFYNAAMNTTTAGRVGRGVLQVFDIVSVMTAPITVEKLLIVIASVSLVCEDLFWLQKSKGTPVTEEEIFRSLRTYQTSEQRENALARIQYDSTKLVVAFGKEGCMETLRKAMEISQSKIYRDELRRRTVADV